MGEGQPMGELRNNGWPLYTAHLAWEITPIHQLSDARIAITTLRATELSYQVSRSRGTHLLGCVRVHNKSRYVIEHLDLGFCGL